MLKLKNNLCGKVLLICIFVYFIIFNSITLCIFNNLKQFNIKEITINGNYSEYIKSRINKKYNNKKK